MNRLTLILALLFTTSLPILADSGIKVLRTTSDRDITKIKRQVLKKYGIRIEFPVISRNDKNEIFHLEVVRYSKAGKKASTCASDAFGALVITPEGCQIADLGYEKDLVGR
ncbi:MAG: hypothetical protein LH609_22740 [Rudanella sp.]|nr:hypothetical protein [Rudanella sp.]